MRLFLNRVVVDQAFPLELKVLNAEKQAVIAKSRVKETMIVAASRKLVQVIARTPGGQYSIGADRARPPIPACCALAAAAQLSP